MLILFFLPGSFTREVCACALVRATRKNSCRDGTKTQDCAFQAMAYRVFTAPAESTSISPQKPDGETRKFSGLRDVLNWAAAMGRDTRSVLIIDEKSPAKVTVRSSEDAARTIP
jgi:hypothetical protein